MHRCEEVVLAAIEHIIVYRYAGRHQFGDAAFHEFFGQFGVLELFAYRHALAGAHEFGQISVEGMVGKSGELHALSHAIGAAGECDSKYFRCLNGIFAECFVEVAHAKQQHCIGMLCFHLEVLFHQWGFYYLFCHLLLSNYCLFLYLPKSKVSDFYNFQQIFGNNT